MTARSIHGSTRLDRWACPLCGWAIEALDVPSAAFVHGTTAHPATLPGRMTIADRLRLIPALAREVAHTIGAPNPTGYTSDRVRAHSHPRLPISTAALDALAPEDGDQPMRPLTLLVECSRIVWESLELEDRASHPQPLGRPTFAAECRWLLEAWADAQAALTEVDFDWIDSTTAEVLATLASIANVSPEVRYACPDCGEPMHLGMGGWMVCETGRHEHPGPERLRDQWRRRPPMSTNHLAAELRITAHRIHVWHDRGKIAPTRQEGRTLFWLPWDAVRLVYPDIARAIERAEQELAS